MLTILNFSTKTYFNGILKVTLVHMSKFFYEEGGRDNTTKPNYDNHGVRSPDLRETNP